MDTTAPKVNIIFKDQLRPNAHNNDKEIHQLSTIEDIAVKCQQFQPLSPAALKKISGKEVKHIHKRRSKNSIIGSPGLAPGLRKAMIRKSIPKSQSVLECI